MNKLIVDYIYRDAKKMNISFLTKSKSKEYQVKFMMPYREIHLRYSYHTPGIYHMLKRIDNLK